MSQSSKIVIANVTARQNQMTAQSVASLHFTTRINHYSTLFTPNSTRVPTPLNVNPHWIQSITSCLLGRILGYFNDSKNADKDKRLSDDGIRWQRAKQLTNSTSAFSHDRDASRQHCLHMNIDDSELIGIPHATCSSFHLPARNKLSHQLYSCISPDAVFSYSCFDDLLCASVRRICGLPLRFAKDGPGTMTISKPQWNHGQAFRLAGPLSLPPGIRE